MYSFGSDDFDQGMDERMIHAAASHGYAVTVHIMSEREIERILYATAA